MANRKRIAFTSVVTCNGMEIVEHSERKEINYNYSTMSDRDIKFRQNRLDKDIARKKALLGIVTEQPTLEYFWSFMGQEQVIDECRAKDLIIKGITVYAKDNEGNRHSVVFDGLKLITNMED